MTALDMIREGFGVWADEALGANIYTTPIVFTLLFLLGFLATAILKTFRIQRSTLANTPSILTAEGREVIDDANTARLLELETEIAASKMALLRFTETLSTTFAHLSGGLAIFDADKSLHVFNPALSDLLDLDPVWLAKRPSISDFISMLRENRHLPEKKNFLEWRRLLTNLQDAEQPKNYDEEWTLPDGRVFRVTGQPHPQGAIAFLFEDISVQVSIERQHRLEVSMNQSILNGLSDAVVLVSAAGRVKFTNTALGDLFGERFCETLVRRGIPDLSESKLMISDTTDFWPKLKTYIAAAKREAPWEQLLTVKDKTQVLAGVSTLPDGATLVVFKSNTKVDGDRLLKTEAIPDPLHFVHLEKMLCEREISLEHAGFDAGCVDQEDTDKIRRILWYLAISTANNCRNGGEIILSSCVDGQYTALSCHVSDLDHVDDVQENVARNLLKSLATQPGGKNYWIYDAENDPHTISFKTQKRLKLSAL
ncbi:hypothetical protein A9Q96_11030 [Rhodobacterales bacterium 52_120_T64]|nr:hypothetical protein A9Q96_11030 [Rhodobacterales bacterium 52_120_T64]